MLNDKGRKNLGKGLVLVSGIMFPFMFVILGFNLLSERLGWITRGNIFVHPIWVIIVFAVITVGLGVFIFYSMWEELKQIASDFKNS